MDHFVLFLFFLEEGGGGKYELLQKKYKSCITAQSKKYIYIYIYILQISPEKIFMQKKFSLYF